ncbi:transcriptional regulator, GntR family protein [Roseobacter sp. SK209-2-6]|uniref:GntR family transcriptional regulator n=1 Tax=Roseobacter sp. SK209-2-6 TaxID=388739 RepID=UPI0000F3EB52|nr:GntR family transcriptional regulator [Roseobacter sp. SK209-2-6]EBA16845.1 transcriptional regulator, GntR family protein [Roseobacter sp. SK209-2-6]
MNIADFLAPDGWLLQSSGPRYVQLRHRLEQAIAEEVLPSNSALPPEREIAGITGLSRVTVRKAIQELVEKGVVEQRQGSGTFVREPLARVEQSLTKLTSFTEDMRHRGVQTSSTWLERGVFLASEEEIETLNLEAGASVSRIRRLRLADGHPMALEHAALPLDILPNPIDITSSLYDVLDQSGNRPVRALQKISAINLGAAEANLLGVAEGTAGLRIRRISFLENGRTAELTRSVYRGDAYDFVAELRLTP